MSFPSLAPKSSQGLGNSLTPGLKSNTGMIHSQNPLIPTGIRSFISTSKFQLQVTDEFVAKVSDLNTCLYLEDCMISTRWERRARSRFSGAFIQSWKTKESRGFTAPLSCKNNSYIRETVKTREENTINFRCFCNGTCRHWGVPAGAGNCSSSSIPEEQTLWECSWRPGGLTVW